jgi:hypothetical protein
MPRRSNRAQENRYADSSGWLETSVNGGELRCEFNCLMILASLGDHGIHAIRELALIYVYNLRSGL